MLTIDELCDKLKWLDEMTLLEILTRSNSLNDSLTR